jgi:hypothetical protein
MWLRGLTPVTAALAVLALAGCGGSSGPAVPTIGAARVTQVVDFQPTEPIPAGKPTTISFVIQQPDGTPLTRYKRGPGPHTGVHLIYVHKDLASLVHHHPPIAADGVIRDRVTLPAPGPWRLVIDVYPATGPQTNFQLFETLQVAGAYRPQPLPPSSRAETVDGYRFTLRGASHLKAIQPAFVKVDVTDPQGRPAKFTPYYGALAHAIFFRRGSLDYFHTHVCTPGATGCTSVLGPTKVTGTSTKPGKLSVGVLVPVPGIWRLFLQVKVGDRVLTAPFTLKVG